MGVEQENTPNGRRAGFAGRLDGALDRLETLFEVGASAMVPILTLLFPIVLGAISFVALPYELGKRPRGDTDPGEGYVSIAPYMPEAGDTPEEEPPAPEPPAPDTKGVEDADPKGVADTPVPDVPAGDVATGGDEPATAPAARAGSPEGVVATPTTPAPAGAKTGGRSSRCVEKPNPKIVKLGEGKWSIERDLLDYYATHFKALDGLGWVEHWKSEDKTQKGFKMGGIRCNNDLYLAGFRSGDIVLSVNDQRVGSIPEALAVYARNRKSDLIRIEYVRRGKPGIHSYRLK